MESTNFINPKLKAIVHKCSKGVTKGLRIYKVCRLHGAYNNITV